MWAGFMYWSALAVDSLGLADRLRGFDLEEDSVNWIGLGK